MIIEACNLTHLVCEEVMKSVFHEFCTFKAAALLTRTLLNLITKSLLQQDMQDCKFIVSNLTSLYFAGSMYRLHNTSEHSGVTNMYSLSNVGNGSSRANTPVLQNRSNHQQYLFDTGGGDQGSFFQWNQIFILPSYQIRIS